MNTVIIPINIYDTYIEEWESGQGYTIAFRPDMGILRLQEDTLYHGVNVYAALFAYPLPADKPGGLERVIRDYSRLRTVLREPKWEIMPTIHAKAFDTGESLRYLSAQGVCNAIVIGEKSRISPVASYFMPDGRTYENTVGIADDRVFFMRFRGEMDELYSLVSSISRGTYSD